MHEVEKTVKTIEKICLIGIVALSLVAGIGLCILLFPSGEAGDAGQERTPQPGSAASGQDAPGAAQLARWTDTLPDGVRYGSRLPVTAFKDGDGAVRDLDDYRGSALLLLFWGSWCPICDEAFSHSAEYASALEAYPQVRLLLIDKLDPDRGETVARAQEHLLELGVPFESLYDEGLPAYKAYGVKQVPTLLMLDAQGRLRAMTTRLPDSGDALRALLDDALSGSAAGTERFVREKLTGADGGVYTSYVASGDHPTGRDVLSESQGMRMQIALLTDDRALFDQSYRFARERLMREGVFCWYAAEDGKQASANALLDDLRIYDALRQAEARWGGYAEEAAALAQAIWDHNVIRGRLAGFYDFSQKRAGDTLPLFYIDLRVLRELAREIPGYAAVAEEAGQVLRGGRISDAFPLYYSAYDYRTKRYSEESLNTAEALMTLYHAVRAGIAGQDAIDWLCERVQSGTLAARYGVDGEPVTGFAYDSTAAYALAALIGAEAGDAQLYTAARNRMEKYHVTRQTALFGSFSDRADGSDIIAFDQLLPLLVYTGTKSVVFD